MTEWKEYKLGEIADVRDGTHDSPKESNNGFPLVTSKNIKNGKIDLSNTYLISKSDYEFVNQRSKVDKWDILFSMIGTIGECAIVKQQPEYAIKNVGLFKTHGDELLAYWIYYYIHSQQAKSEMRACIKGSTQQYISLTDLRNFPIELPIKEKQLEIVSILSSLDDKIDLLYRENATLEAMAETLFRQWFIEEAKEDWEDNPLGKCIKLVGGGTPKTSEERFWNGNVFWLSGGDIANNHKSFVSSSVKSISEDGLNNSSAKLLPENAMVISARGTVGKYCLLSKPMAFSQSNYGILPIYNDCYFFTYLLVAYHIDELQSAAYGSVFDTITTKTFEGVSVLIPKETSYIVEFEKMIEPYFSKMKHNNKQIQTLIQQRDSLLPKLMSGEVKI